MRETAIGVAVTAAAVVAMWFDHARRRAAVSLGLDGARRRPAGVAIALGVLTTCLCAIGSDWRSAS